MNRGWTALAAAWLVAGLVASARVASAGEAEPVASVREAFAQARAGLSLRYRYERVDDDDRELDAGASTLRTTLSLETAEYRGWRLFLEAENVAAIFDDDGYDNRGAGSLSNGMTDRPVVADPAVTEPNQIYVRYRSEPVDVRIGRRELVHADARLVGNVGWRQNHQAFSGIFLAGSIGEDFGWDYAFLDKVHRIFGDNQKMNSHLLAGRYEIDTALSVRGYLLALDYEDLPAMSTTTVGAELTGSYPAGPGALDFEIEAADQREAFDNSAEISAGYRHGRLGYSTGEWNAAIGWEVLEGEPGSGRFTTPLATLHKWNGWADKFLSTPDAGLEDIYLSLGWKRSAWAALAVWHDFDAESTGTSYGRELDASLSWQSPWRQTFAVKYAAYDADAFSVDTTKWMLWTAITY